MKVKYVIACAAIVAALMLNLTLTFENEDVNITSGTSAYAVEAPPLMDEYTHACTWVGMNTASVRAEIISQDGSLGSVTISGSFIYDSGSEISCEAAFAWCSRYGPCVRSFTHNVS